MELPRDFMVPCWQLRFMDSWALCHTKILTTARKTTDTVTHIGPHRLLVLQYPISGDTSPDVHFRGVKILLLPYPIETKRRWTDPHNMLLAPPILNATAIEPCDNSSQMHLVMTIKKSWLITMSLTVADHDFLQAFLIHTWHRRLKDVKCPHNWRNGLYPPWHSIVSQACILNDL